MIVIDIVTWGGVLSVNVVFNGVDVGNFELLKDNGGKLYLKHPTLGVIYNKGRNFQTLLQGLEPVSVEPEISQDLGKSEPEISEPSEFKKPASGLGSVFDSLFGGGE